MVPVVSWWAILAMHLLFRRLRGCRLSHGPSTRFPTAEPATRFAIGALAVALCLLGGHPQIFVYAMILAGGMAVRNLWFAYSEGMNAVFRLACVYVSMVVVGVSACAVQLLPFLEFSGLSARTTEWSYGEFVTYSLPLRQIATIFFPYLYGGGLGNPINYFGAWN